VKTQELSTGNIRTLLGLNIGNTSLIPNAINYLITDFLVESDFFAGDFLYMSYCVRRNIGRIILSTS